MSASTDSIVKSLHIEDFQSHAKTSLGLPGPGQLCVITGHTDSGKTAIVRALRLLIYNTPQGNDYIRVGRTQAAVAIEMTDGCKVIRERSRGSVNRYRVTKPGESPQVLEGFGNSVPLEVQEATGVRVVSIGESLDLTLNLSEQLDGPFLGKSVSGPAKAKILGALAGTEEVDEAQRGLGTDLHRANQEEKRLADTVQRLETKTAEYDYLPVLAQKIEAMDSLLNAVKITQGKLCNLQAAKAGLDSLNSLRIDALSVLTRWAGLAGAITLAQSAQNNTTTLQALTGYKSALERIADEFAKWYPLARVRWAGLYTGAVAYEAAQASWERTKALVSLATDLLTTKNGMVRCDLSLARWQGLEDAQTIYDDANECANRLQALTRLSSRIDGLLDAQLSAGRQYGRWYRLDDAIQAASEVPDLAVRLSALLQASADLTGIRQAKAVAENALFMHADALCDARSLYADTLISMGRCPLCGSTVSSDSIKSHIEEVA